MILSPRSSKGKWGEWLVLVNMTREDRRRRVSAHEVAP